MNSIHARPPDTAENDEELIDTLIATSVVAKRLAEKLRKQQTEKAAGRCRRCNGKTNGGRQDEQKG